MEESIIQPNSLSGHPIYISGKDVKNGYGFGKMSLKDRIITELSCYSFVRATPTQLQGKDIVDNYLAIVSSSAFVFIFSKHSLSDPHCLNQLGMALSYNIPTITVRDHDFELPKPLPTRYYQTEIVDKTGFANSEKRSSTNLESLPAIGTLASALTRLYDGSLVHNFHSHSEFNDQLLRLLVVHCRESKVLKAISSSASDASSSGEETTLEKSVQEKNSTSNSIFIHSPYREKIAGGRDRLLFHKEQRAYINETKQLIKDRNAQLRRKAKSRSGVKTKSACSARSACSPVVQNGQALNFNISVIPPSPAPQSPLSFRRGNYSRPFKIVRGLNIGTAKLSLTYGAELQQQNKSRMKGKLGPKLKSPQKQEESTAGKSKDKPTTDVKNETSSDKSGTQNDSNTEKKEENQTAKKKRSPRHSLRRYSSLPVIPTQYLVTSKENKNRPIVYHYPPGATSPMRLSVSSPQYSGAEEDEFESIHLSRTCTPVIDIETDAGYVTPTSPTHG